jgi:hypothetical protein
MKDLRLERAEIALAEELKRTRIPASIEIAVMGHFGRVRRRRRAAIGAMMCGAIAAAMVGGIVIGQHRTRPLPVNFSPVPAGVDKDKPAVVTPSKQAPARAQEVLVARPRKANSGPPEAEPSAENEPFIAIPYTVPLGADEQATVVRMSLPVPALAAAGLPIVAPEPDALAQADVLVGQDGRARAVRVLSISTNDRRF